MSHKTPSYSFHPWLRQGIGNKITNADLDAAVTAARATINIQLELRGNGLEPAPPPAPIAKDIAVTGPGDIVGIDSRIVVRTEPRHWITNFEPNYVPHIEFYDEDFPWRYTPAKPGPAPHRLRPWIMLIVLKEGQTAAETEFTEGQNIKDRPLPFVDVKDPSVFPPADQLWAWAHVHVNRGLTDSDIESTDMATVLPKLQATLDENADLACSRIVCPRKLDANTAYHAFLMPVFESGRLAGLQQDLSKVPFATASAWADYPGRAETASYPYYYRWYFRTGTVGDFEYLVRLLKAKPVDKRVGTRDMDVLHPGSNLPGIEDPTLGGVLKLGGALRVPRRSLSPEDRTQAEKYDKWAQPYPVDFQKKLASFISLADDYSQKPADDANRDSEIDPEIQKDRDPLITPPLYGCWHALVQRLLKERNGTDITPNNNWVHELNLDPRFRVAAGFGTRVVQDQQEEYMKSAWEQLGDVLEAQRRIRLAQLAKEISWIWYERHLKRLAATSPERAFAMTALVHSRVLTNGVTVRREVQQSMVPRAVMTAPVRRVLRPRARLVRSLPFENTAAVNQLLTRINEGEVHPAPPKVPPKGAPKVGDVVKKQLPPGAPPFLVDWLRRYPWLPWLVLAIALAIAILLFVFAGPIGAGLGAAVAAGGAYLTRKLLQWLTEIRKADSLDDEASPPEAVDSMPRSPDFKISVPSAAITPHTGASDSLEAVRFKAGIKDARALIAATKEVGAEPVRKRLDFARVSNDVVVAIHPDATIPKRVLLGLFLPSRFQVTEESFVEPLAYPEFDTPMYKPLAAAPAERFLPNLNLIEQNSITLLETNQKFIEAYMVGLNHEFARELLWREYFTDQRGSYFRQFWDVSSFLSETTEDEKTLKEQLRDIPPLHKWLPASNLGDHDNRELSGANEEEVVLVVRSELLKKYPNTVIYAQHAKWVLKKDGTIDNTKPRELDEPTDAEEEHPPRTKIRTPLYEAKVEPDIYFFGFDLTTEAVMGGTGESPGDIDKAGWFFVLREREGELKFGADIDKSADINDWNDLSWEDIAPAAPVGSFIKIDGATPTIVVKKPTAPDVVEEKGEQYEDDKFLSWNKDMSSAEVAYILYQAPVLVAVHGAEMLRR
jgi:hypothetical protein